VASFIDVKGKYDKEKYIELLKSEIEKKKEFMNRIIEVHA
jgi:hypothetical protein